MRPISAPSRNLTAIGTLIIVPAYNEERVMPGTLAEFVAVVAELDIEIDIVVVDDGSRDATAAVAHNAGVLTLQLPVNTGVGGAVRTGLRHAEEHRYERAVVVDADGQHDPHGVAALLARLDEGADVVIGAGSSIRRPPATSDGPDVP